MLRPLHHAAPAALCRDITVEFWARTPAYTPSNASEQNAELFSFSTSLQQQGGSCSGSDGLAQLCRAAVLCCRLCGGHLLVCGMPRAAMMRSAR